MYRQVDNAPEIILIGPLINHHSENNSSQQVSLVASKQIHYIFIQICSLLIPMCVQIAVIILLFFREHISHGHQNSISNFFYPPYSKLNFEYSLKYLFTLFDSC